MCSIRRYIYKDRVILSINEPTIIPRITPVFVKRPPIPPPSAKPTLPVVYGSDLIMQPGADRIPYTSTTGIFRNIYESLDKTKSTKSSYSEMESTSGYKSMDGSHNSLAEIGTQLSYGPASASSSNYTSRYDRSSLYGSSRYQRYSTSTSSQTASASAAAAATTTATTVYPRGDYKENSYTSNSSYDSGTDQSFSGYPPWIDRSKRDRSRELFKPSSATYQYYSAPISQPQPQPQSKPKPQPQPRQQHFSHHQNHHQHHHSPRQYYSSQQRSSQQIPSKVYYDTDEIPRLYQENYIVMPAPNWYEQYLYKPGS